MRRVSRRGAIATGAASVALLALPAGAALALIDLELGEEDLRAARAGSARPLALERDLVAQWRRGLRDRLGRGPAIAYLRWDKAMILAGLAREERLRVRQTRIGRSLFKLELG
jgi:hypothetical protein